MHQIGSQLGVADDERLVDQAILALILDDGPCSVQDVRCEIGSRVSTDDAVARLRGAGLLAGEEVLVATRAARRAAVLLGD